MPRGPVIPLAAALMFGGFVVTLAMQRESLERLTHPAIAYATAPTNDPVTRLRRRLADGLRLDTSRGPRGYLKSLLAALDVPESSQIMVFAKTSLQRHLIDARTPRAVYFNDDVSVAWVPGGLIEIASQDPTQGVRFYAIDPNMPSPSISERSDCLACHNGYRTGDVAGMIESLTYRRPLEERWGGWYVTGNTGSVRHFGNVDIDADHVAPATDATFNWPSVEKAIDASRYLSAYSDIAALMVFEHQMQMMNLFTDVGWTARIAAHDGGAEHAARLRERIDAVVDYMLFVDEAPLASPLVGNSGFAEWFSARGPADRRGRSLRHLDLQRRVLRYPCSYLIYSTQFDQLPADVKTKIYERLWTILSGADASPRYAHLSPDDRRAIIEILRDTKKGLPSMFLAP
jgi:hypothetical protein